MKLITGNTTIEGTPEELSTFMLLQASAKSLVEPLNEEQCYQFGIDKAVDNQHLSDFPLEPYCSINRRDVVHSFR